MKVDKPSSLSTKPNCRGKRAAAAVLADGGEVPAELLRIEHGKRHFHVANCLKLSQLLNSNRSLTGYLSLDILRWHSLIDSIVRFPGYFGEE
jgi:hypothetical protein